MASPEEGADRPTLRTVCNELGDIKRKRFNIGIQLGISRNKLLEFEDEQNPFSAIIDHWLKGNAEESGVPISWLSIVAALKSKDVDEPRRAQEIKKKYCQQQEGAKAFERIEKQLKCPICLETYTNPKQLQCNHVYCQQCLVRLVTQDQQGERVLTCPNCRQVTPVPASGVADLQPAFQTNNILEIMEEHKKEKMAPSSEEEDSVSSTPVHDVCPSHDGVIMEIYCESCEEQICWKCIMKDEKHHNHGTIELHKFLEKKVKPLSEKAKKQLMEKEKALEKFAIRIKEISDQKKTKKQDIHKRFAELHKILDDKEGELVSTLEKCTQAKLKRIEEQSKHVQTTYAQLQSCLFSVMENLTISGQMLLKNIAELEELIITYKPDMLLPLTEADMIFSGLEDLSPEYLNYKVYAVGSPDPSKCSATGKGVDTAAVGEMSTVTLQLLNFEGQPCKVPGQAISCELTSEIRNIRERGIVEGSEEGQYKITYQATIKGKHHLHIRVEGQHIAGSPFPVSAESPVEDLSSSIQSIHGMKKPLGVAVNQNGEVVMTEYYDHCVSVFSPSGQKLRSFGKRGFNEGEFNSPYGVAVDGEENILVADRVNHRIQKLTGRGKFLAEVGKNGSGTLQFDYPCGIAVNTNNAKIYVADTENNRVQILNSDLSYSGSFGEKGNGKGQFIKPCSIACDSTGNVYVADCNVQVFTANGKFLRKLDKDRKYINIPQGLAVDSLNRVYVSNTHNGEHNISVFTPKGEFLTSFGDEKDETADADDSLHLRGLAVDSSGVVYACDHRNDCILLF